MPSFDASASETGVAVPDTLTCFTAAEAASIRAALVHRDQLEVDIWEVRQVAQLDSLIAAQRLERYKAALKAEQDPWWERVLTDHRLWFILGVVVGVQANR